MTGFSTQTRERIPENSQTQPQPFNCACVCQFFRLRSRVCVQKPAVMDSYLLAQTSTLLRYVAGTNGGVVGDAKQI